MNSFATASKALEIKGWLEYLKEYQTTIEKRVVTSTGRPLDDDKVLLSYVSKNLPLCLGENILLETVECHENAPTGDALLVLQEIIVALSNLDVDLPYGAVDGIDALYY
jgi:hypothetical protein